MNVDPLREYLAGCFDECCAYTPIHSVEVFVSGKRKYGVECSGCGRMVGFNDSHGVAMTEWNKMMRAKDAKSEARN